MNTKPNREEAYALLTEYNQTDSLIKHALAVEGVMRHFSKIYEEDEEKWGVIGLLHDLDYEQFPQEHCIKTEAILREKGIDESYIHAILSHGYGICTEVMPEHKMEKVLYATDELTGLINAAVLMRPNKSILDFGVKSLMKKYKSASFAAKVNREVIAKGAQMLDMPLNDLMKETIEGMKEIAQSLDLAGTGV